MTPQVQPRMLNPQLFFQSPEITAARFERIKKRPDYAARVNGLPENHETIRRIFTRREKLGDMTAIERDYLRARPDSAYNSVLRNVSEFPDYIDILPPGAIARKIPIMLASDAAAEERCEFVFIAPDEHTEYVRRTAKLIYNEIMKKEK